MGPDVDPVEVFALTNEDAFDVDPVLLVRNGEEMVAFKLALQKVATE